MDIYSAGGKITASSPTGDYSKYLYFPHITSHIKNWETEIGVVNTSGGQTLNGVFKAYSDAGVLVSEIAVVTIAPQW